MKLLIYTDDAQLGEWAKETIEDFGRGIKIIVSHGKDPQILGKPFSYIIIFGEGKEDMPGSKQYSHYPTPADEQEKTTLKRNLWALYRDTLRDMIGDKCSCGLYDICHCH